jgi:hypothetical protein
MMKRLNKKQLSRIRVSTTESGFTVWIRDAEKGTEHWIVDGSLIKEDGEIRLSTISGAWKTVIEILPDLGSLLLMRK